MRIVLATVHLRAGGAERVMSWLASELTDLGHDVTLLTWLRPDDDFFPLPSTVEREGIHDDSSASWVRFQRDRIRFARAVRRHARRADVVLSFITDVNVAVLLSTIGCPTPIIVSERNTPQAGTRRLRNRYAAGWLVRHRAARLVVQTAEIARLYDGLWRTGDAVVIPNACILGLAGPPGAPREPVVLSVGRLEAQKDHETLLRAWARISCDFPDWRLRIVGAGSLRRPLADLVQVLQLTPSVEFVEPHHGIALEYERASVFVLPSRHEGFPNALLEAAAHGCACVATDCPGASAQILEAGAAGVLVPVGDEVVLAAALRRLLGCPGDVERLGTAGARAAGRFQAAAIASAWDELLQAAAARRSGGAGRARTDDDQIMSPF